MIVDVLQYNQLNGNLFVSREILLTVEFCFLVFAKAFDSVPHERLLYKLEQYGIARSAINIVQKLVACEQ